MVLAAFSFASEAEVKSGNAQVLQEAAEIGPRTEGINLEVLCFRDLIVRDHSACS